MICISYYWFIWSSLIFTLLLSIIITEREREREREREGERERGEREREREIYPDRYPYIFHSDNQRYINTTHTLSLRDNS
jgi:hypothetical protein